MTKKTSTPALAEALARARTLAAEMNAATDELNSCLADAERAIANLSLGVTARVNISYEDGWFRNLAFGKEKQQFKLLLESGMEGDGECDVTPLLNASRGARLEAVEYLAPLVDALVEKASQELQAVRAKTELVKGITATIRASTPEDIPF